MKNSTFIFEKAMHAVLYKRFDLKSGRFVEVGDFQGVFAPEDRESGAEYRCLDFGRKGNKILHSSDLDCGLFYSTNVFLMGEDENGETLPFEEIEQFNKKIWNTKTQRALLPRGYDKGKMTWWKAIYYVPVEQQPYWPLSKRVKQEFPECQIVQENNRILEVFFE